MQHDTPPSSPGHQGGQAGPRPQQTSQGREQIQRSAPVTLLHSSALLQRANSISSQSLLTRSNVDLDRKVRNTNPRIGAHHRSIIGVTTRGRKMRTAVGGAIINSFLCINL